MSQNNIDFGTFPDDPSADAIRTAFTKVQNNFNQLFSASANTEVTSVNRTAGAGITVNYPTGLCLGITLSHCVLLHSLNIIFYF